ncbi:MAG: c-type cytochrome [Bryobacteraceae bacterium]
MKNTNLRSFHYFAIPAACLVLGMAGFSLNQVSAAPPSGADTFKAKCGTCHGPDGSGSTPMGQKMKVRDLRSAEVQKQTDDELTAIVTNGKPPMPGYGKTLGAADISQLVAYLRSIAAKS